MSTKTAVVLASAVFLLVGFAAGRISAPGPSVSSIEEEASANEEMSADHALFLQAFQVATQKPYAEMSVAARRVRDNTMYEYERECEFSITKQNRVFCTKFIEAVAAHNALNQEASQQAVLKSVREDLASLTAQ